MDEKLNRLLLKIQELEHELLAEIHSRGREFGYQIEGRRIRFNAAVAERHHKFAKSLRVYLRDARLLSILTAPVIWSCLIPLLFLHAIVGFYQMVCFPIYGIPKALRQDYIVMDRGRLLYLNPMERINCLYCSYANGLLAYIQEIAGRTEQYWCPIKHAMHLKNRHSRYQYFLNYGDAKQFREKIEEVRRDFNDLKKPGTAGTQNPKPKHSDPLEPVSTHPAG